MRIIILSSSRLLGRKCFFLGNYGMRVTDLNILFDKVAKSRITERLQAQRNTKDDKDEKKRIQEAENPYKRLGINLHTQKKPMIAMNHRRRTTRLPVYSDHCTSTPRVVTVPPCNSTGWGLGVRENTSIQAHRKRQPPFELGAKPFSTHPGSTYCHPTPLKGRNPPRREG